MVGGDAAGTIKRIENEKQQGDDGFDEAVIFGVKPAAEAGEKYGSEQDRDLNDTSKARFQAHGDHGAAGQVRKTNKMGKPDRAAFKMAMGNHLLASISYSERT